MKGLFTVGLALVFLVLMSPMAFAQEDWVADGYAKILALNKFEGAPHYPIVADEVHAGFDLDKDGNLEFIFVADHSDPNGPPGYEWSDGNSVYVYEWNPGHSAFESMWAWSDTNLSNGAASFPTMTVADLDGDTDLEIVLGIPHGAGYPAADVSPTVIYIFEFGSAGLPTEPTATWTTGAKPGTNTRPSGMASGDIDGDGQQEVAVAFRAYSSAKTNDALIIFSLDGGFAGDFTQYKTEMIDTVGDWGSVYSVDVTDLDNDGHKEAYFSSSKHTIYEANGADSYTLSSVSKPAFDPFTIQAIAELDIDGDSKNELVIGKTDGSFCLLHSVADVSAIDSANQTIVGMIEPAGCRGLTAGDYDGDGKGDIFLGGNYGGSLWRIEYTGSGAITDLASYTYEKIFCDTVPASDPRTYHVSFPGDAFTVKQGGSASTDMNGNGLPEVVIVYEDGDSLQNWIVMVEGNGTTAIELNPGQQTLKSYVLNQNYPNPFNPATSISFQLPATEYVTLKVYDMLGSEIKTIAEGVMSAGLQTVDWDGTNNSGKSVASGAYIYTLQAGSIKLNKRMILTR
jgi:hypothetical protein